ncbi:MAG: hypothetical protein KC502_08800 [Myxococcales bacterium]|nr:hypothetical protein [Myxococcales bacterium]
MNRPTSNRAKLRAEALTRSAIARAEASERFFWWRVVGIFLVATLVAWLGIRRVEERSAGVRAAHQLAQVHDQLREQVEINRRLGAQLTGKKQPVELAREAKHQLQMQSPKPGSHVEVK